jgi:hypothetical protein
MLICIEEGNGLKHAMKQRICEKNSTYLDQEKKIVGGWILVGEHGCDVECCPCMPDVALSAEGDAFGDVAYQRGLNADGL